MKTSSFYKFVYQNGMKQVLELISKPDYDYYKELISKRDKLKESLKPKSKKEKKMPVDPNILKELEDTEKELKRFSKPFFVEESPMYKAIDSGIIDIDNKEAGNFGKTFVTVSKIDNEDLIDNDFIDNEIDMQ
jgi:hypothetical protein